jgi:hypothetical protein
MFADAPPPPPVARMLVVADEWSLVPSRPVLRAGTAIVQLANIGEDDHDLLIRRVNANGRPVGVATSIGPVQPGEHAQSRVALRAGRYRLLCTIADHASRGMRAAIRVRAR